MPAIDSLPRCVQLALGDRPSTTLSSCERVLGGTKVTKEAMTVKKHDVTKCPACEDKMQRIGRSFFMRALFGSKCYYCRDCRQEYLRFAGHYFHCGQ
jgi:transposase-like protein